MGKIVVASQDIAIVASHLWTERSGPVENFWIGWDKESNLPQKYCGFKKKIPDQLPYFRE